VPVQPFEAIFEAPTEWWKPARCKATPTLALRPASAQRAPPTQDVPTGKALTTRLNRPLRQEPRHFCAANVWRHIRQTRSQRTTATFQSRPLTSPL